MNVIGPSLIWVSNGEAGDGQSLCQGCGEERDAPHTWDECVAALRAERDSETDNAIEFRRYALAELERLESALRDAVDLLTEAGNHTTQLGWPVMPQFWRDRAEMVRRYLEEENDSGSAHPEESERAP